MTPDLAWYEGRSVLVTGGLGFLGSHLAEHLAGLGASVAIVDSSLPGLGANPHNLSGFAHRVRLIDADLRDPTATAAAVEGVSCIFNLAGQVSHVDSMTDPLADLDINVRSHLTLLEAIRRHGDRPRVVYASTRQVYGRPQRMPVDERHPVDPTDVNGIDKLAAERLHLLYERTHEIPTVVLRLTNSYGPRQLMHHGRQGFIPLFIRTALDGGTIELFGGGGQRRDANYVDDVVDAFLRAGVAAPEVTGTVFNLGAQPAFTLRSFADLLVSMVGAGTVTSVRWPEERAKIDIGDFVADHRLITDRLGWAPRWGIEEGLAETVAFYRAHRDRYW